MPVARLRLLRLRTVRPSSRQSLCLLSIQNVALGAEKNVQPAITKPTLLGRQLPQAAAQGVVWRSTRSIADGLAIGLYQAARPALAHLVGGYETGDSLALGGGR
jgi:hypothetical protein